MDSGTQHPESFFTAETLKIEGRLDFRHILVSGTNPTGQVPLFDGTRNGATQRLFLIILPYLPLIFSWCQRATPPFTQLFPILLFGHFMSREWMDGVTN
jgi:hypothetical protein